MKRKILTGDGKLIPEKSAIKYHVVRVKITFDFAGKKKRFGEGEKRATPPCAPKKHPVNFV